MANGIPKRNLVRDIKRNSHVVHSNVVRAGWEDSIGSDLQLILLDRKYWALPEEVWKDVLQYSGVDSHAYVDERFDCDDFAWSFKGNVAWKLRVNGVGTVVDFSGSHAYNVIIVVEEEDIVFKFLEPQNDKWVVGGPMYKMENGFVIF